MSKKLRMQNQISVKTKKLPFSQTFPKKQHKKSHKKMGKWPSFLVSNTWSPKNKSPPFLPGVLGPSPRVAEAPRWRFAPQAWHYREMVGMVDGESVLEIEKTRFWKLQNTWQCYK